MVLFVQVRLAVVLAAMSVSVAVDAVSVVGIAHEDTQAIDAPFQIPFDETAAPMGEERRTRSSILASLIKTRAGRRTGKG